MGRFLTDVVGYANCVPVAGSVEFHAADGIGRTPGAAAGAGRPTRATPGTYTVDQLARLLEVAAPHGRGAARPASIRRSSACRCWRGAWPSCISALARAHRQPGLRPRAGAGRRPAGAGRQTVRDECTRTLALLEAAPRRPGRPLAGALAERSARRRRPSCSRASTRVARAAPAGLKTRCTATCTWGRCWSAATTSSSSTSRASRSAASTSGAPSTARCATSPACCARSTTRATPRCTRSRQGAAELERLAPWPGVGSGRCARPSCATYREVAQAGGLYGEPGRFDGRRHAARPVRAGKGALRAALRNRQPARLGRRAAAPASPRWPASTDLTPED